MMSEMILIWALAIPVCGVCFYIPKIINEDFMGKYGVKIWSWLFSVINAIAVVAMICFYKEDSFKFSVALAVLIVVSIVAVCKCIWTGRAYHAETKEIIKGLLAQILSTLGVFIIIVVVVLIFLGSGGEKKKKK